MDEVYKPKDYECYTPTSEHFRALNWVWCDVPSILYDLGIDYAKQNNTYILKGSDDGV
jgi:hypothetical protein